MSDTLKRIDEIVKGNPVVLFMKGNSQFPMCGFSGRAIQILKACGATNVKTFNVLEDEEIRQASRNTPTGRPFRSSTSRVSSLAVLTSLPRCTRLANFSLC